jgi:hypothetical protein
MLSRRNKEATVKFVFSGIKVENIYGTPSRMLTKTGMPAKPLRENFRKLWE